MCRLKRTESHFSDIFRKVYRIRKDQTDDVVKRKWKKRRWRDGEEDIEADKQIEFKSWTGNWLCRSLWQANRYNVNKMSSQWEKNDRIKVRLVAKDFQFPKVVFFRTDSTTLNKAELSSATSLLIFCLLALSFASNHWCVLSHKNSGFIFNGTPSSDFSISSFKYVHSTQQPYSRTSEGTCYKNTLYGFDFFYRMFSPSSLF